MKTRSASRSVILFIAAQLATSSAFGNPHHEGIINNSALTSSTVTTQKRPEELHDSNRQSIDTLKQVPSRAPRISDQMLAQPRRNTSSTVTNADARSVLSGDIYTVNALRGDVNAARRVSAINDLYSALTNPANTNPLAVEFRRFQTTSEFTNGSQDRADIFMRFVNQLAGWSLGDPTSSSIPSSHRDPHHFANDLRFVTQDPSMTTNHFRHPFFAHQDHDNSYQLLTALSAASYLLVHPSSSSGLNTTPEWVH